MFQLTFEVAVGLANATIWLRGGSPDLCIWHRRPRGGSPDRRFLALCAWGSVIPINRPHSSSAPLHSNMSSHETLSRALLDLEGSPAMFIQGLELLVCLCDTTAHIGSGQSQPMAWIHKPTGRPKKLVTRSCCKQNTTSGDSCLRVGSFPECSLRDKLPVPLHSLGRHPACADCASCESHSTDKTG